MKLTDLSLGFLNIIPMNSDTFHPNTTFSREVLKNGKRRKATRRKHIQKIGICKKEAASGCKYGRMGDVWNIKWMERGFHSTVSSE